MRGTEGEGVTSTVPEGSRDDKEEDVEELMGMNLPEDLVGRILAMVPFPYVYKARVLSKQWLAKFSSTSFQDEDEEKTNLATSFQRQVSKHSTTWNTLCPVFISKENSLAYDLPSSTWRRMPSLSFLPENIFTRLSKRDSKLQMEGALLLISTLPEGDFVYIRTPTQRSSIVSKVGTGGVSAEFELYVANVLTQTWKQLPPRPTHLLDQPLRFEGAKLIIHPSAEMYTVVTFYTHEPGSETYGPNNVCHAEIYDSRVGAWTGKRLDLQKEFLFLSGPAYHNGVIYRVVETHPSTPNAADHLVALNVEEGTFEVLQMLPIAYVDPIIRPHRLSGVDLVVCSGSLMMTVFVPLDTVIVVRIDPGRRTWVEVARGPPADLDFGWLQLPGHYCSCDGDQVFFASNGFANGMLAYNVRRDEWTRFPCPKSVIESLRAYYDSRGPLSNSSREYESTLSSFQPGLNPFMAV